jgi:hypothetical protein
MGTWFRLVTVAACLALAACQTVRSTPRLLTPESLSIRTDPPGASCTIGFEAVVLATAASTPETVDVPREVPCHIDCPKSEQGAPSCTLQCRAPDLDVSRPIELVCRKQGYLEYRRPLAVGWKSDVDLEEGASAADFARGAALTAALVGTLALPAAAPALAAIAVAAPAATLTATGAVVGGSAAAATAAESAARDAPHAIYGGAAYRYRSLPDVVLTPATFPSEAARDTYFAALKAKLEATAAEQRQYISSRCRIYPCTAVAPSCAHPVCDRRRALITADIERQIEQIQAQRAQARIAAAD